MELRGFSHSTRYTQIIILIIIRIDEFYFDAVTTELSRNYMSFCPYTKHYKEQKFLIAIMHKKLK